MRMSAVCDLEESELKLGYAKGIIDTIDRLFGTPDIKPKFKVGDKVKPSSPNVPDILNTTLIITEVTDGGSYRVDVLENLFPEYYFEPV